MTGHLIPTPRHTVKGWLRRQIARLAPAKEHAETLPGTWDGMGYDPDADIVCINCGWEFRGGETQANCCPRCTSKATWAVALWQVQ